MKALKAVNYRIEERSLRRGMAQALALADVDEKVIREEFTGHTNEPMLMRYLGWGMNRSKAVINAARAGAIAASRL